MRSVKPGRGPSFLGGIFAIGAVIFGIFWTAMASNMGAPDVFPLFGVVFIILGIVIAVYNFKNATGKNRYSSFDITSENEEPDPLNVRFGNKNPNYTVAEDSSGGFCPFCGSPAEQDHEFCKKCGKKI